jgi:hypothetical protein
MFQPGSKGWINKYFELIETKEISIKLRRPKGMSKDEYFQLRAAQSGITFGFPSEMLFTQHFDRKKWTNEEHLKVLLFESHLMLFELAKGDVVNKKEEFIGSLLSFYGKHDAFSITKIFTFFLKETQDEKLEKILAKRVDIRIKILENKFWINYLSNVFAYLDLILYNNFLQSQKEGVILGYSQMAADALIAIAMAASSDGIIEEKEEALFNVFLASANLSESRREEVTDKFKKGAYLDDLGPMVHRSWLYKRFLLDISLLTILTHEEVNYEEEAHLKELCNFLNLNDSDYEDSLLFVESFVINNKEQIYFLNAHSSYEKMVSSIGKRWVKVLGRNKDKLAVELKQSKELVYLIKKSTSEELSKEEKEKVKTQFMDIIKSMPSLAIFMLPGGAILLPLILKIIPDLIPSAFRDNELEK